LYYIYYIYYIYYLYYIYVYILYFIYNTFYIYIYYIYMGARQQQKLHSCWQRRRLMNRRMRALWESLVMPCCWHVLFALLALIPRAPKNGSVLMCCEVHSKTFERSWRQDIHKMVTTMFAWWVWERSLVTWNQQAPWRMSFFVMRCLFWLGSINKCWSVGYYAQVDETTPGLYPLVGNIACQSNCMACAMAAGQAHICLFWWWPVEQCHYWAASLVQLVHAARQTEVPRIDETVWSLSLSHRLIRMIWGWGVEHHESQQCFTDMGTSKRSTPR